MFILEVLLSSGSIGRHGLFSLAVFLENVLETEQLMAQMISSRDVARQTLLRGFPLALIGNRFGVYLHIVFISCPHAFQSNSTIGVVNNLQYKPKQRGENRVGQTVQTLMQHKEIL